MDHHSEEILRLNKKIKQLIWQNEQSEKIRRWLNSTLFSSFSFVDMSRGNQLQVENKRLSMQVDEMKEICSNASSLNVKYRMDLEKETSEKENLREANTKLKLKLNEMAAKCHELTRKMKMLESNLARQSVSQVNQPRVQMIGSVKDIMISEQSNDKLNDLQKRYDKLEVDHNEALNVIDDLEFELGDVITYCCRYVWKAFIASFPA